MPHRGKRNEPAWVSLTLAKLAAARGVPPDVLGPTTTDNAARLFNLQLTQDE
jgi:TatD DNase family protein